MALMRELRNLGREELKSRSTGTGIEEEESDQQQHTKDPHDYSNIYFSEVCAENWAAMKRQFLRATCSCMYSRYADNRGWRVEILSDSPGEHGGFKEIISRIVGQGAYSYFKFESEMASRATRACNRSARPHSYLCLHCGNFTGAGRSRRSRD